MFFEDGFEDGSVFTNLHGHRQKNLGKIAGRLNAWRSFF
jgi:hypothetical protein